MNGLTRDTNIKNVEQYMNELTRNMNIKNVNKELIFQTCLTT